MTSEEVAAWVQAVGSLAAIIAAFAISSIQFKHAILLQQSEVESERRRRYMLLIALIEAALEDFGTALEALRGPEPEKCFDENSTKELMDEFYQAFLQISPLDMPSAAAVKALVTLRDRLKTAAWNANEAVKRRRVKSKNYKDCVEAMAHNLVEVRSYQQTLAAEFAKP